MDDEVYMLTTTDNPYSPFDQPEQWYWFDRQMGYYTPEYLARIAKTSMSLSDAQNDAITLDAINEIVALNINGMYRRVKASDYAVNSKSA